MRPELDLAKTPLKGTNLIEANAGTGKTYNITGLFIRMLLEEGLLIESILVVTYTKAAVADLKAKIYRRLLAVRDAILSIKDGTKAPDDPFACAYAETRSEASYADLKKIKDAIRDFDQCSVFTIHGFCQRMLKENAFSGKIAYDVELTGDSLELIKKPVQNFWRNSIYKAHPLIIPHLLNFNPDDLISFYMNVQQNPSIEVLQPEKMLDYEAFTAECTRIIELFEKAAEIWTAEKEEIMHLLDAYRPGALVKKSSYRKDWLASCISDFESRITAGPYSIEDEKTEKRLRRLTLSMVQDNLTGKGEVVHTFFNFYEEWYSGAVSFKESEKMFLSTYRYKLYEYMKDVLEQHKQNKNLQSYDDLILRMRNAVVENGGHSEMTSSLLRKYKAVLIDEFQDTDPYQYDIFQTAFGNNGRPFFMIGDPKQAIYSFRGADVFAYLKAAQTESFQHTLTENYRSDPALVDAVNMFFEKENSFLLKEISYSPSKGAVKPASIIKDGTAIPPVTIWDAGELNVTTMAKATARHIAEMLNKAESGNAKINGEKIKPSDIAVLCRSKTQLIEVKRALSECLVPAVVSGSESVFKSVEAMELINMLAAVLSPFSTKNIKTALATPVFGYSAQQIHEITETPEWDEITESFRQYNDMINMKGFAPMFFSMANRLNLYEKTAQLPSGERKLTNYIHLAELLQRYEAEKKSAPQELLKMLKEKVTAESQREEDAELKMDSDDNAVQIVTIHKSKGLEYNIVYTPFLMFSKPDNTSKKKRISKFHRDGKYLLDTENNEESAERAELEEKAEDIRIAYVALTRAKYACFTAWGKGTGSDKSAMSYLINSAYEGYSPDQLMKFAQDTRITTEELPKTDIQTYTPSLLKPARPNRTFKGDIPAGWQINSFSRLIHSSGSNIKDMDQFTGFGKQQETGTFDIFSFPKGAKAGTCLHECMEEILFEDYSKFSVLAAVQEKLEKYSFDTAYAPAVADNIINIIEKDIDGINLSKLKKGEYIPEMEFQMKTDHFTSEKVSDIFSENGENDFAKACSTLSFESMQGYMNGFADLIFRQNGRYYVLDWKSNHLGHNISDYNFTKMHAEMLSSHYYMQMYVYTLALHMHLKKHITDYSFEEHMGGGVYIFMRGANLKGNEGFYIHRPNAKTVEELEKLVRKQ